MLATISLTVVLPLLPVTATSGTGWRRRQAAASLPRARRLSSTTTWGKGQDCARITTAAQAPRRAAWSRNS